MVLLTIIDSQKDHLTNLQDIVIFNFMVKSMIQKSKQSFLYIHLYKYIGHIQRNITTKKDSRNSLSSIYSTTNINSELNGTSIVAVIPVHTCTVHIYSPFLTLPSRKLALSEND